MYVCVRVRVCVWGRRSWEKSKEREMKMKREKKEKWKWKEKRNKTKERIKKQERRENINLFIQINTQTNRRMDGQIDRHKSFIDMRYYTEQYSKSNSIKSYSI